jgi:hypothetical protein
MARFECRDAHAEREDPQGMEPGRRRGLREDEFGDASEVVDVPGENLVAVHERGRRDEVVLLVDRARLGLRLELEADRGRATGGGRVEVPDGEDVDELAELPQELRAAPLRSSIGADSPASNTAGACPS